MWNLPIHSNTHTNTQQVNFLHLLDMWKKRSGELSHYTTQTALPTLNQQHSSPVHPVSPLFFLLVQEDSATPTPSRCTGQLWLQRLAQTHQLAQWKQHTAQNTGCSYLLRLWQLVEDMDEHTNEYMNGGMNHTQDSLGQRKRMARQKARNKMQNKPCSQQMPVAALGSVTRHTSARRGKSADKINLLGN